MEHESQHRPGRYLAIQIAGKYYAFNTESVREITSARDLFPPPLRPAPPSGGVTRRGLSGFLHTQSVRVPIFDLHVRLGGAEREIRPNTQTRIVIVETHGSNVGFYADRLSDMIQARAHEIRKDTIIGHGRPKSILTLDRLWTRQELAELP
jgi:chemotaxis signal transduction protein